MAGHEKKLRDRTEVEDLTNGAREESWSPWQDEIPIRKVQCVLVTPDRQDQLIIVHVPTPAGLPGQATCWTGEVQLDERLSFRGF